jgi:phosphate uptake regulator
MMDHAKSKVAQLMEHYIISQALTRMMDHADTVSAYKRNGLNPNLPVVETGQFALTFPFQVA